MSVYLLLLRQIDCDDACRHVNNRESSDYCVEMLAESMMSGLASKTLK